MKFDTDSKPVLSWISDSSKSHSTRKNRKYMLGLDREDYSSERYRLELLR